jgi:hypothetical protein
MHLWVAKRGGKRRAEKGHLYAFLVLEFLFLCCLNTTNKK